MRARNYIAFSACILGASLLGLWILIFVLPDVRPYTKFEGVLWFFSLVLMLPTLPSLFLVALFALPPQTEESTTLVCIVVSALLWPLLIGLIRCRTKQSKGG